jgi:hypothetical protein
MGTSSEHLVHEMFALQRASENGQRERITILEAGLSNHLLSGEQGKAVSAPVKHQTPTSTSASDSPAVKMVAGSAMSVYAPPAAGVQSSFTPLHMA